MTAGNLRPLSGERQNDEERARRTFPSLVDHYAQWMPVIPMVAGANAIAITLSMMIFLIFVALMIVTATTTITSGFSSSPAGIYVAEIGALLSVPLLITFISEYFRRLAITIFRGMQIFAFWVFAIACLPVALLAGLLFVAAHHPKVSDAIEWDQRAGNDAISGAIVMTLLAGFTLAMTFVCRPPIVDKAYCARTASSTWPPTLTSLLITVASTVAFVCLSADSQVPTLGASATIALFAIGTTWRLSSLGIQRRKEHIHRIVERIDALTLALRKSDESLAACAMELQRDIIWRSTLGQRLLVDALRTPLTHVLGVVAESDLMGAVQEARSKAAALPVLSDHEARGLAVDACFLLRRALVET